MNNWPHAFETLHRLEGGFVNDPNDPGGATNFGISLRWLAKQGELDGHLVGDFDHDGDVDADDIKAMDISQAETLYKTFWWQWYGYDAISDSWAATKILCTAVNMGASQAHRLVQYALAACGHPVTVDGMFGPATLAAINASERGMFMGALRATQADFYRHLVEHKPQFAKYERGWLARAYT